MSFNPFKRRQKQSPAQAQAQLSGTSNGPKPGITIGMQSQQGNYNTRGFEISSPVPATLPQQYNNKDAHAPASAPTLGESNYRTSLIMPHLTRRFTLLRAPDGSVVTPDTMRAHLRAQRARARAAGQPGGQHFLTEQEEDEIIEQMRAQARREAKNNHLPQKQTESFFGGTDGFGGGLSVTSSRFDPASIHSTGSSTTQHTSLSSADRMGSLTESLGDLRTISSSSSSGSLFSGRSSERDNAYLRGLKKSGSRSGVDTSAAPIAEEEEEEDEEEQNDHTDAQDAAEEEDSAAELAHDETDAMPGGFGASSRRVSKAPSPPPPRLQTPDMGGDYGQEQGGPDTRHIKPNGPRKSQLLSSLSPEAFNRVSMALEEVIGGLSPAIPAEEADEYEFEAGSTETDGEEEEEINDADDEDQQATDGVRAPSRNRSDPVHSANYNSRSQPASSTADDITADADDEAEEDHSREDAHLARLAELKLASPPPPPQKALPKNTPSSPSTSRSIRTGRGDGATSPESDAASFQSAREDAGQSNFHGYNADATEAGMPSENSQATIIARNSQDETDEFGSSFDRTLPADDKTPRIPQQGDASSSQRNQRGSIEQRAGQASQGFASVPEMGSPAQLGYLNQHNRGASSSSDSTNQAHATASSSPSMKAGRPMSPDASNHEAPLLSANAIAARNQQRFFFPANTANSLGAQRTPDSYASGFRASPAVSTRPVAPSPAPSTHLALAAATRGVGADGSRDGSARVAQNGTQPAQRPSEDISDSRRLFPRPPAEEAARPTVQDSASQGNLNRPPARADSSTDATSETGISEFERQFEQDTEADDVWAAVARNLQSNGEDGYQEALDSVTHPYSGLAGQKRTANDPGASTAGGFLTAANSAKDSRDDRPISHIPPAEAATQFEDAGFSMDQLAQIQASLVRSASGPQSKYASNEQSSSAMRDPLPPLPSVPSVGSLSREVTDSNNGSAPTSPRAAAAKLEKARERARMIAERARSPVNGMGSGDNGALRSLSPSASFDSNYAPHRPFQFDSSSVNQSPQVRPPSASTSFGSPAVRHGGSNSIDEGNSTYNTPGGPAGSGMTKSSSIRSFRSQVMYDVTTSHRPTSPPPRNAPSYASGQGGLLPSLHDISLQQAGQSYQPMPHANADASSLSHAIDATADRYANDGQDQSAPLGGSGNADYGGLFNNGGYPEAIPEEAREAIISYDAYDADASAPFSPDQSYTQPTHSNTWTPSSATGQEQTGDTSLLSADSAHARGGDASAKASPASVQSGWSGRSGGRNIVDDVAAQAQAATQALKGPQSGDGGPHVRPKKSKTLSRKKSRKNPGKIISTPQLLSTSQQMDHAQPIPRPDESLRLGGAAKGKGRKPIPVRHATDYKNDPKIGPVTLLEPRASSSFGHEGQLPHSPYMPPGRDISADSFSSPPRGQGAYPRSPASAVSPAAFSSPGSAQPSPRVGSGSESGVSPARQQSSASQSKGLGRIMSRMRMRKTSESGASQATIEPYSYPNKAGSQDGQLQSATSVSGLSNQGHSYSPVQTRIHTPRGPSPFGLSGLNAQGDRTLPDSGASRLAGLLNSPSVDHSARLSPVPDGTVQSSKDDADAARPDGPVANLEVPGGVGLGLGNTELSRSTSHLSPQLGASNDTVKPPALKGASSEPSPKLGSPAAIQEPRFGGSESEGTAADTSAQTIRKQSASRATTADVDSQSGPNTAFSARRNAVQELSTPSGDEGQTKSTNATGDDATNSTSTDAEQRKSLHETIVRRTLIFPSDASVLEEKRRSLASISSRRKSRRHMEVDDQANASYAALMNAQAGAKSPDSPRASHEESSTKPGEINQNLSTPSARQSRYGGRTASLRPPSPDGHSRRASGTQSSYAGSLYDMYIGDDGESLYDGDDPRASLAPGSMSGRNHIEVTERADGSVIWQVVAGLGGQHGGGEAGRSNGAGRTSTYTGYSGGHSRVNSDTSQLSFGHRDSSEMSPSYDNDRPQERTFTGLLKDEDSRSLFAKRRQPRNEAVPALPDLQLQPFDPKQLQQLQQQERDDEEQMPDASRPSSIGGARPSMSLFRPSLDQQPQTQQQQQLAFDMATPNAGVTRVVYSNDLELEHLLESLARQTDAAKFHFDRRNLPAGMSASASDGALLARATGGSPSGVITRSSLIHWPNDDGQRSSGPEGGAASSVSPTSFGRNSNERVSGIASPQSASSSGDPRQSAYDANRRRVEDEIMSLLNATALQGGAASNKRGPSTYLGFPSSVGNSLDLPRASMTGAGISGGAGAGGGLERIEDEEAVGGGVSS